MRILLSTLSCLAALGVAATGQTSQWRAADTAYAWSFPRDHWARPGYKTEWWYLTGHLADVEDPERRYGYQFTFFRVGLTPDDLDSRSAWAATDAIMGHAALIDLASGKRVFSEVLYRASADLGAFRPFPERPIAWSRAPAGTDGQWTIDWNGAGFDIEARDDRQGLTMSLSTTAAKPLIFQGPGGFSRKAPGETSASQYYSLTRLETTGLVRLDGREARVTGESWMDKEFGSNQLGETQVGWDWFSLQLQDGREIMLYMLRDRTGEVDYGSGTVVSPDGEVRYVSLGEWTAEPGRRWRSPSTDAAYPVVWTVTLPDLDLSLRIVAARDAQENVSTLVPGLNYWEGAVDVLDAGGITIGRGFVELTGYGTDVVPAI